MSKAIKLLVNAFEACGKSTLTSTIKNSLIINFDHKSYGFKALHANIPQYAGMEELTDTISEKIEAYEEKKGNLPKVVVFDTVTQMYSSMQKYNGNKYSGFTIHSNNNSDTLNFNHYLEELVEAGISVIIVAHCMYDSDTSRYVIPAAGQFAKAGSWLSVVNDSIYIERKSNKFVVHLSSMKFPSRSTLKEIDPYKDMKDYDINEHIEQLLESKEEAGEWSLD